LVKYILKRVIMAIVTIYLVATITFFTMYLVPGGPFLSEKAPSQATLDALNAKYSLDKPVIVQYKNYLLNLLKGDLGPSLKQRGRTVNDIIATGFPVSARVGGIAIIISFFIGVPMGCIAAFHRRKWLDNTIILISSMGVAIPSFVISTVLMYIFSVKLGWLPTYGLASYKNYIMPLIALSFYPTAYITRLMRSSMLDVMGQDYMRTARAKGLRQSVIIFKHALRNAITPVVTYLGPLLAYTLTGSFAVEKIFTIPGIGREFISSTINRDYPMIMGLTVFLAALIIIMNMAVDIINKFIDPRIQLK
jgi:oligopeptide transport system permease protein